MTTPDVMLLAVSARTSRPVTTPHAARAPRIGIPVARRPARERGGTLALRFPPSVFPLWEPPFQIPPFQADSTKGGKPQGATARRPSWKTAQNRRRVGGFLQRRFQPPPYGGPAPPPLDQPRCARPQSWGQRVGRAETGCGRSGPRTVPALRGPREARGPVHRPSHCAAGFPMRHRDPVTRRARTARQSSRQPANGRGLSCRLPNRPTTDADTFSFCRREGGGAAKTKSGFWGRGGRRIGGDGFFQRLENGGLNVSNVWKLRLGFFAGDDGFHDRHDALALSARHAGNPGNNIAQPSAGLAVVPRLLLAEQFLDADAQRLRDGQQHIRSRRPAGGLPIADVRLVLTDLPRKLALGQSRRFPKFFESRHYFRHVQIIRRD